MALEPIPVVRAVYLRFLLDVVEEAGGCDPNFRSFNLPTVPPEQPDAYLPLNPVLSFSRWAAGAAAIEDLGLRAGSRLRLSDLETGLRAAVLRAPTLGAALKIFCDRAEREQTPMRCWIVQEKAAVRICSAAEPSAKKTTERCNEWFWVMAVLAVVRHFAGKDASPTAISFQSSCPLGHHAQRVFSDTSLRTGGAYTSITFPASLLRLSAICTHLRERAALPSVGKTGVPGDATWDFPTSLRTVLRAYLDDGRPSIELAAEIAGTTVRTLQRRLAQLDLTYSDILEEVRFNAAKRLLHKRGVKVTEAAYALGYSDPAHFTRAFRRMAGVNPRQYRKQLAVA